MGTLMTSTNRGVRQVRRAAAGLGALLIAGTVVVAITTLMARGQPAPTASPSQRAVVASDPVVRGADSGGADVADQALSEQAALDARSGLRGLTPAATQQRAGGQVASPRALHYAPFTTANTQYRAGYDRSFVISRAEASRMWTPTDQYSAAYDSYAPGRTD